MAETEQSLFGEALPVIAPQSAAASTPYRVLARKYRPSTFADLIGQEHMVRTLRNAFETGRIPQAWMLTGVRGVGKTTTARILARALNYQTSEGIDHATVDMPKLGTHCEAIIEGRHIDVLEIDAASNNGVENIRQINDTVRYAPVYARVKVYIVDEVHMLSTSAFNAFLKTLEEPPPHAKFIFATTEIRKVPITILSRCQRFDLRRVDAGRLVQHLRSICDKEQVTADDEALALIARASEGSVRDSLSLLDQAIAHGSGHVSTTTVQDMMGLADRTRIIDLAEAVLAGHMPQALTMVRDLYAVGADPAQLMIDLAEFIHLITRLKIIPQAIEDAALSEVEKVRGKDCATRLSVRVLSQAWQMILKAIPEVQMASRPLAAAEMALVRLAYMADLPPLDEVMRRVRDGQTSGADRRGMPSSAQGGSGSDHATRVPASINASSESFQPVMMSHTVHGSGGSGQAVARALSQIAPQVQLQASVVLRTFHDLVALAAEKRDISLQTALKKDVRPVRLDDGVFEFALMPSGSRMLAQELSRKLQDWTGRRWMVAVSSQDGAPTLEEQEKAQESTLRKQVESHPLVQAVLNTFPDAKIVSMTPVIETPVAEEPAIETLADILQHNEQITDFDVLSNDDVGDF